MNFFSLEKGGSIIYVSGSEVVSEVDACFIQIYIPYRLTKYLVQAKYCG